MLDHYRWKNRVLILFAQSDTDMAFRTLRAAIDENAEAIADRDLVLVEVIGADVRIDKKRSYEGETDVLRRHFDVSQRQFSVVLIGKDGGVKLKGDSATTLDDLFALIDSMPMRKREIRQRKRSF